MYDLSHFAVYYIPKTNTTVNQLYFNFLKKCINQAWDITQNQK